MGDTETRILEAAARGAETVEEIRLATVYRYPRRVIKDQLLKLVEAGVLIYSPEAWTYKM